MTPDAEDALDLPAELDLDLVDPSLREQVGDLVRSVQAPDGCSRDGTEPA